MPLKPKSGPKKQKKAEISQKRQPILDDFNPPKTQIETLLETPVLFNCIGAYIVPVLPTCYKK